jgi:hypothetical protein
MTAFTGSFGGEFNTRQALIKYCPNNKNYYSAPKYNIDKCGDSRNKFITKT